MDAEKAITGVCNFACDDVKGNVSIPFVVMFL